MNAPFLIAAVLLMLMVVVHSVMGERLVFRELLSLPDLPRLGRSRSLMRQTLRFNWHVTSVIGIVVAATLVSLAAAPEPAAGDQIATAIAIGLLVCALLAGISTRGRHYSWTVFLASSALVWFGM